MDSNTALFINGPINSGKSTVARLLAEDPALGGRYIEGDTLVDDTKLNFDNWVKQSVQILAERACQSVREGITPFCAFPLNAQDWALITAFCENQGVNPLCITLAPKMEIALSNRSNRELHEWERMRIREMYTEGFHSRCFSILVVDNTEQSPEETVRTIRAFLWPKI